MNVEISSHATDRCRERLGINKRAVERQANLAYNRGYYHNQMKGALRKWVDHEALNAPVPVSLYIYYNNHLFLFQKKDKGERVVLVTMLKVPTKIMKNIGNYLIK